MNYSEITLSMWVSVCYDSSLPDGRAYGRYLHAQTVARRPRTVLQICLPFDAVKIQDLAAAVEETIESSFLEQTSCNLPNCSPPDVEFEVLSLEHQERGKCSMQDIAHDGIYKAVIIERFMKQMGCCSVS